MMTKLIKYLLPIVFFIVPFTTYADISQPVYDTKTATTTNQVVSGGTFGTFQQKLGTGLTGSMTGITLRFQEDDNGLSSGSKPSVVITCFDDAYITVNTSCGSQYSGGNNAVPLSNNITVAMGVVSTTTPISLTFNSAKYYAITIGCSNGCHTSPGSTNGWFNVWGSANDIYNGGNMWDQYGHTFAGVTDLYFYITGGTAPNQVSYLGNSITWITPTNHASTTAGINNMSFNYTTDPAFPLNTWTVNINDITSGTIGGVLTASSTFTGSSGTVNFSANLITNHVYMGCTSLSDSTNTNSPFTSPCIQFSTGANFIDAFTGNINDSSLFTIVGQCATPSSILDVGGGVSYAFCTMLIPAPGVFERFSHISSLLATKFPFTYLAQTYDLIEALHAQATSTIPDARYTFPLGASFTNPLGGSATTSISFFSPATIVADVPIITTMRTYMGYALYLMFGLFVIRRIIKII